ncbi:Mannosyl-oligosaccharide 1,2-alpha-mannosidase IB, partial [Cichlidogyrus casuarinus]
PIEVSLFEYNIRFFGGLLSAYSLTRDKLYLDKAIEFADSVLSAFNTPTGIPASLFNFKTKSSRTHTWSVGGCSILSEFGTLQMEFAYLSELTGNPIYSEKVDKIRKLVASSLSRNSGLYYNHYNSATGSACSNSISFGAMGDSFYEYLIKEYKRTNGKDVQGKQLFEESIEGAVKLGVYRTSKEGNAFLTTYSGSALSSMEHLTCFMGGTLAYSAPSKDHPNFSRGSKITDTCRLSYVKSKWGIGPDKFYFTSDLEAVGASLSDNIYIQRPEVVESYFYMWRLTKDTKYRDWAWDAVLGINKTRTKFGFGGIQNVYNQNSSLDSTQQSFFLAETLKYLYLIFCEDDVISLDRWVFNTEAHPLPIHDKVNMGPSWKYSRK